ncbi:hypothetical protein FOL47_009222 [Perkinsus chesapeaki]|uniref:Uncharacterized protein n=1 Tax=Perkinsus chesapeaki TaxID=330153 RepID=A0A7J6L9L0_PERCH|nr:hypothetical protein FOL47_009222 [Perkinsus chesapeaki]
MVSQVFRKFQQAFKNVGTPSQYGSFVGGNSNAAGYGRRASQRVQSESSLSAIGDYICGWRTIEILLNGTNRHNPTVLMDHVEDQRKIIAVNPLGLMRLQSWDDFFVTAGADAETGFGLPLQLVPLELPPVVPVPPVAAPDVWQPVVRAYQINSELGDAAAALVQQHLTSGAKLAPDKTCQVLLTNINSGKAVGALSMLLGDTVGRPTGDLASAVLAWLDGIRMIVGERRRCDDQFDCGLDSIADLRLDGWNYILLAYGVIAFLSAFTAKGFFMNFLAIAQVLALAIPYHDSRNPAHDADLAYYSLWGFLACHLLLWYQFLSLLSRSPFYCTLVIVLITAHASFRTREWVRLMKDTMKKRGGQQQQVGDGKPVYNPWVTKIRVTEAALRGEASAANGDSAERQRRANQRRAPME